MKILIKNNLQKIILIKDFDHILSFKFIPMKNQLRNLL